MLRYPDGSQIAVGDSVSIMHGEVLGVVEEVIFTSTQQSNWNLEEPGVMLLSAPFGRVFYPASSFEEECLSLVARATAE